MEYRYWLTFTDMATVTTAEVLTEEAYDPKKNYDKMDEDEEKVYTSDDPFVVVGTPVDGKFASFDPTGRWIGDMETATGDVKKWLKKLEYTCTKNGSTYESTCTYTYRYLGVKGSAKSTAQPIPQEPGAFMIISSEGEYSKAVINSPDSLAITDMAGKWSVSYTRSK